MKVPWEAAAETVPPTRRETVPPTRREPPPKGSIFQAPKRPQEPSKNPQDDPKSHQEVPRKNLKKTNGF